MMFNLFRLTLALGGITLASAAYADDGINAKPGVYDPDKTRDVSAQWVSHEGLPDAGASDHALILVKAAPTAANTAAGAVFTGVQGRPASQPYGFSLRADSYAGAGAPRFDLLTEQGTFHFIGGPLNGTVVGTTTDSRGRVWVNYVFDPVTDAYPPIPPGSTIAYLDIIQDEDTRPAPSGAAIVDNMVVDNTVVGKPGSNK